MPGPENDQTLLGVDSNKNNVRDDVEIYIYNEITKDPKLYRAYFMWANSYFNRLKNIDNVEKVNLYNDQLINDLYCVIELSPIKEGKLIEKNSKFMKKLSNTKLRVEASEKIARKIISKSRTVPENKAKLCR